MYNNEIVAEQPMPREINGAELKTPTMTRQDYLRQWHVNIKFLHVGCVIQVGCKEIAFSDITTAMQEFNEYVNNPEKTQEKWFKIFAS